MKFNNFLKRYLQITVGTKSNVGGGGIVAKYNKMEMIHSNQKDGNTGHSWASE